MVYEMRQPNRRYFLFSSAGVLAWFVGCGPSSAKSKADLISNFDNELETLQRQPELIIAANRDALSFLAAQPESALPRADKSKLVISNRARRLMIACEIVNENYYTTRLQKPYRNADNSSDVTIGIGYDLGQHSKIELEEDWSNWLDADAIDKLSIASTLREPLRTSSSLS
jgi:hypothetical protein